MIPGSGAVGRKPVCTGKETHPMTTITDPHYLTRKQYKDDANLSVRIALHERYSINPGNWFRWVFEHFRLPAEARLLELGCGPGHLWVSNLDRIPTAWEIALSDFSAGMLAKARENLSGAKHPFSFRQIDAQSIPYSANTFDAVIADHMLYHVPDRARALAEIRRVLKEDGWLYAATIGADHMIELRQLVDRFGPGPSHPWAELRRTGFNLEQGGAELAVWFGDVQLDTYEDGLAITEVEPLIAYIRSMAEPDWPESNLEALAAFVANEIAEQGAFHIRKDTGLFIARP